jgi:hypothetical protein
MGLKLPSNAYPFKWWLKMGTTNNYKYNVIIDIRPLTMQAFNFRNRQV